MEASDDQKRRWLDDANSNQREQSPCSRYLLAGVSVEFGGRLEPESLLGWTGWLTSESAIALDCRPAC